MCRIGCCRTFVRSERRWPWVSCLVTHLPGEGLEILSKGVATHTHTLHTHTTYTHRDTNILIRTEAHTHTQNRHSANSYTSTDTRSENCATEGPDIWHQIKTAEGRRTQSQSQSEKPYVYIYICTPVYSILHTYIYGARLKLPRARARSHR